ncbi:MAG TPA: T9SS type A sorting domain-containing protein [Bacteroidia bacterium]|nr:T9SS type A sorting domain-containing protein [Bacteroidia bacterium]
MKLKKYINKSPGDCTTCRRYTIWRQLILQVSFLIVVTCWNQMYAQDVNIDNSGINIGTGTYFVTDGDIILQNSGAIDNDGWLHLKGDWTNNASGLINNGSGIVEFDGSSPQAISGTSVTDFNFLAINNSSGVTLGNDENVNGTLVFTIGKIITGSNTLSIAAAATISGAGAGKYVFGNLKMSVAADGIKNFEIGDAAIYAPVNLSISGVTSSGSITGNTAAGSEPNENNPVTNASGINPSAKANRYWTMTNSGIAFTTADATFNYDASEATGNPLNYVVRKFDSPSTWSATTAGTVTPTSAQATGITSFSEFEVGEPNSLAAATQPNDATICAGLNTFFSSTSTSVPVTSVKWQRDDGGGFIDITALTDGGVYSDFNTTTLNITGAAVSMDQYKYRAVFTNINGAANSTQAVLTVNSAPSNTTVTSVTGAPEACSGDVFLMTANPGVNPVNYSWNTNTNPSVVQCSNSPGGPWSNSPFVTAGNTVYAKYGNVIGSGYNVCAQATNACGSAINKCIWIRGKVSIPGNIAGSTVACSGNAITYNCGASTGASIYTWTLGGSTAPITGGQGGNVNVQVTFPAGFTSAQLCVTASLACGGSSTSAPRCMLVSATPAVPGAFTSGPSRVCPGQSNVLFTVGASNFATGYNWIVPSGATIVETPPFSTSIHVNFPAAYSGAPPVCAYATSTCASSSGKCKTVGSYIPGQPGAMTGPLTSICYPSTVQYSVPFDALATSYTWVLPAGATNIIQNGPAIQFTAPSNFASGFITVYANTNLCTPGTSPPRSLTLNGKPAKPGPITANSPPWCPGATINFSIVPPNVPLPYFGWTATNGTIGPGQGTSNVDITWGTGSGLVKVQASNACGASPIQSQSFSSIVCREEGAQPTEASGQLIVYPNPAHNEVTVSIDVKENTHFNMVLRDISGRTVLSEGLDGEAGLNTYSMNLENFSKGIYMLEVQTAGDKRRVKVVVE